MLQAAKHTLTKGILYGVIIQHCNILLTPYSKLFVLPYVDLPGFLSPCIINGDRFCPDLLFVTADQKLFLLEMMVGFEAYLNISAQRNKEKYQQLLQALNLNFISSNF